MVRVLAPLTILRERILDHMANKDNIKNNKAYFATLVKQRDLEPTQRELDWRAKHGPDGKEG